MANIWLPMSAGQSHIAEKYVDSHATEDPTVFIVGPEGGEQPIKIPDAPHLDLIQLKDILEWQDEIAHQKHKEQQVKNAEKAKIRNKPGYSDKLADAKAAMVARSDWARNKKLGKNTQYF